MNQGVDRLTLSCLMDIDEKGNVVDHKITESIIRVDRRMSYEQVRCILEDGDTETRREYREFVPMFFLMREAFGCYAAVGTTEGLLILIFLKVRSFLTAQEGRLMYNPTKLTVQQRSLKTLCCWQMRLWQRNIARGNTLLYTALMKIQIQKRWRSF